MWYELHQVARVWNEPVLKKKKDHQKSLLSAFFQLFFLFFWFYFCLLFFSCKNLICGRQGMWQMSLFFYWGGTGLVTRLLSLYPPRQRSPATSAMRSPAEVKTDILSVKFQLGRKKHSDTSVNSPKKYLGTKTRLILPERELFLCQDASRLHLLSTSKTLLLPQLLCRTATQTYATTCLGKTEGLSVSNGIRSLWCNHATLSSRNYPIAKFQAKPKISRYLWPNHHSTLTWTSLNLLHTHT